MLKVLVDDKHIEMTIAGNIPKVCEDLCHVLSSLNEELSKGDPEAAHLFRVMFTKVFMDGVCFDDDREHMEHYLAEGDKAEEKQETAQKVVDDFLSYLKEKLKDIEKIIGKQEDSDEAE